MWKYTHGNLNFFLITKFLDWLSKIKNSKLLNIEENKSRCVEITLA